MASRTPITSSILVVILAICIDDGFSALTLDGNSTTKDILKHLTRVSNMDPGLAWKERPGENMGQPVVVNVSIFVQNIRAVNEMDSEITYDMYYRYTWTDERMKYESGPDYIIVHPDKARNYFWFPDLFIVNSHDTMVHETLDINSGVMFHRDGTIRVSSKLSVTAYCNMNLRNFPHDKQVCGFGIESYMYKEDQLTFDVTDLSLSPSASPRLFRVIDNKIASRLNVVDSGSYRRVDAKFTMVRMSSHFVVVLYIPSIILIILSCLIFWMPPAALMERTLYSVFLLFCMVPIIVASQANIPMTGYIKAVDVWVVSSFTFLAVAVLEVIVLHLLFGRDLLAKTGEIDRFELIRNEETTNPNVPTVKLGPLVVRPDVAKKVDLGLRVAYPAAYILFNIIYWSAYAN